MADKPPEEIAADKAAKLKARVLVDHRGHTVNDIVSGADAEEAIAEGWADGHASAVKFAEKLGRKGSATAGE